MSQIKTVKDAIDIVEIVGERVQLQKAGSNLKAPCPFHSEKTPSFFVNQQLQRYRCFGCGESGDVYEFLQKYEGMTFYESLEYLADRAGVTLEKRAIQSSEDSQREHVLAALNLAKEYYHYLLTQHKLGKPGLEYLQTRGLSDDLIKTFQVGYALPAWDGLIKYLHHKKKYDLSILEQAGLVIRGRNNRYYDRFRDRVVFPLTNHRGQVVGFSGRLLDAKAKEAKYINSPETSVYHKSKMLFGFYEQLQAIRKSEEVVIVEGEFDVLSSIQAKLPQVVAIKGSALTDEQMKLVKRMARRVILALDRDVAGLEATRRAISLATSHNLDLRVVDPSLMTTKDPDDLARSDPKAWRQAVKQSVSVYDFLISTTLSANDTDTAEGRRAIITDLAQPLMTIPHAIEQDVYLRKLANHLNLKPDLIKQDLRRAYDQQRLQPNSSSDARSRSRTSSTLTTPQSQTKKLKLETYVWFLLFHSNPQTWPEKTEQLKHIMFSDKKFDALHAELADRSFTELAEFSRGLSEDLQQFVFELHTHPWFYSQLEQLNLHTEWERAMTELIQIDIKREISDITQELKKLDRLNTKTKAQNQDQDALLAKISILKKKQRQLQ